VFKAQYAHGRKALVRSLHDLGELEALWRSLFNFGDAVGTVLALKEHKVGIAAFFFV
jgi:hypothetical protein